MIVVAINGIALAGKDSFANRVAAVAMRHKFQVATISTIDPIKEFYKQLGWDGVKTDTHRKNLNILKRIWIEADNGPYNWTADQIKKVKETHSILFVMVREFEEMLGVVYLGNALAEKGISLNITRDGLDIPPIEQEFLNSIPKDYVFDYTIFNPTTVNRDIPVLWDAAREFCKKYIPEYKG